MKRKQFTFYRSFWDAIENLPTNKEKLQAYRLVCGYGLNQTEPPMEGIKTSAATVFHVVRPVLDRAHIRGEKALTINEPSTLPCTDDRI